MNRAQFHWAGRPPSEANAEEWRFHDADSLAAYNAAIAAAQTEDAKKRRKDDRAAKAANLRAERKAKRIAEKERRHLEAIAAAKADAEASA